MYLCLCHPPVVRVRFEEGSFTVVEGEGVEVCVVSDGRINSPFTARLITDDITAQGQTTLAILPFTNNN